MIEKKKQQQKNQLRQLLKWEHHYYRTIMLFPHTKYFGLIGANAVGVKLDKWADLHVPPGDIFHILYIFNDNLKNIS